MQFPQFGNEHAAQLSLALVGKLMDALVAKNVMTRAEIDGLFEGVSRDFSADRRAWAEGLVKKLESMPKG
jgi:hypothetical protein